MKRILLLVLFVILLLSLTACDGDDEPKRVDEASGEAESKEVESEEAESTDEETEEETEFGIGEKVELDGQVVEVTEVERSSGDDFDKPKEGHEYVIVHILIENNSDDEISYNPFNFKMKNSNGQIEDSVFTMVDSDTALSSGELAPGGNVSGTLAFEQPVDDDELQLIFEASFWSDKKVIFNL